MASEHSCDRCGVSYKAAIEGVLCDPPHGRLHQFGDGNPMSPADDQQPTEACPHRIPVGKFCAGCDMYDQPATAAPSPVEPADDGEALARLSEVLCESGHMGEVRPVAVPDHVDPRCRIAACFHHQREAAAVLAAGYRLPDPAHDARVAAEGRRQGLLDAAEEIIAARPGGAAENCCDWCDQAHNDATLLRDLAGGA